MTSGYRILAVALSVAVLLVLQGPSCAQLTKIKSSIAGTVFVDGRPQAFGTVQAFLGNTLVQQERCTQSGHYQLKDLQPGTYTLLYLNARGAPIGGETIVEVRRGRFEQVDLQLIWAAPPQ